MDLTLFVGDTDESLAYQAKKYYSSASLIKSPIDCTLLNGVFYTSLGDVTPEELLDLCLNSKKIYYCVPNSKNDSTSQLQYFTERLIFWVSQTHDVEIIGLDQTRFNFFSDLVKTKSLICTSDNSKTLWTIGCSITYGMGVDSDLNWKTLVSRELNLPLNDISYPGTSIIWASDQICRSSIKKGDVVFWGVTGHHRFPFWNSYTNEVSHLTIGKILSGKKEFQDFTVSVLDNDTLKYHNILAVKRAFHHCRTLGAEIVGIGMMDDPDCLYRFYDEKSFYQMISWPQDYVDFGSDGGHPGPVQHRRFADKFIEIWKQHYQ